MKDLVDIMGGGRGYMPRDDDRVTKSDLLDFEMVLHHDTGKAVLVSDTGEERRAVWLPRQHIEVYRDGKDSPAVKRDGPDRNLAIRQLEPNPQRIAHR